MRRSHHRLDDHVTGPMSLPWLRSMQQRRAETEAIEVARRRESIAIARAVARAEAITRADARREARTTAACARGGRAAGH